MKIIRVVYDKDCEFILDIVEEFADQHYVESYSLDKRKEVKSARVIQTDLGSKNVPLIAIEDENQELVAAVYSESNPNWRESLIEKLK